MQSTQSRDNKQVVINFYREGKQEQLTFITIATEKLAQRVTQPIFAEAFKQVSDKAVEKKDRLYLTSNEFGRERTYELMQQEPVMDEAMLFVSGFFGLNVASMRGEKSQNPSKKLSYLICIDHNARLQKFWGAIDKVTSQSTNEKQALENIKQKLKMDARVFWIKDESTPEEYADFYCQKLDEEVRAGYSWLSTPERFQTIHRVFKEKRFLFKPIDLCDKKAMQKLCQSVQALQIKFDTVYLSNVKEYVEAVETALPKFREAVGELRSVVSNETLFIDTECRIGGALVDMEHLTQRVSKDFFQDTLEKRFASSLLPDINSWEFKNSAISQYEALIRKKKAETIEEMVNPSVKRLKNPQYSDEIINRKEAAKRLEEILKTIEQFKKSQYS